MYNFCIKTDKKAAVGFEQQVLACSRFKINNLEMEDCLDGANLADLSGKELENCRRLLIENNIKLVLLDSSIAFTDTERCALLLRKAHLLGVENIKVDLLKATYKADADNDCSKCCSDGLIEKLDSLLRIAKSYGIGGCI